MKFRGHETFYIRKGWLTKGMKNVIQNPDVFVSKEQNPMDVLGIGSNMVKALRYWLPVVGLTEEVFKERKRIQKLTEFGQVVYDNDRYMEEIGTLYLLHYKLASNLDEATAWYYFFNVFNLSEFTKEDFVAALQSYSVIEGDGAGSIRTLGDDCNCILSTYMPRYKTNPGKISPEDNTDCPLGELGLIDFANKAKKTYKKAIPSPSSVNPWVALAIIVDQARGRKEIGLNELLNTECNIGKVLNLDAISMLDVLHNIEKIGQIKIIRTAGLDVVQVFNEHSFIDCVRAYYENI